jgi:outer membrane protein OmpA-like peptidoglycan-associated protein
MTRLLLLLICTMSLVNLPEALLAQRVKRNLQLPNRWALGLTAGTTTAFHDIRRFEYYDLSNLGYTFGAHASYWFGPAIGIRGSLNYGHVVGRLVDNTAIINYGLPGPVEATTNFFEGSMSAVFNFSGMALDKFRPLVYERRLGFYGFLGVGVNNFQGRIRNLNTNQFLPTTDAGTADGLVLVVPVGLGISYKITDKIHLDLEGAIRNVNSDAFDGMVIQKTSGPGTGEVNFGRNLDKVGSLSLSLVFHLGPNRQGQSMYWSRSLLQQAYAEYSENINALENKLNLVNKSQKVQDDKILALEEKLNALERQMRMSEVEMKKDSDGDGVPDTFDKEVTRWDLSVLSESNCGWTREELALLKARADRREKINVDGSGISMDVDKDGLPDHLDKCPTTPGLLSCHGCMPETKQETVKILTDLQSLEFESGKSDFVDCANKRTKVLQDECRVKQAKDMENLQGLVAYLNEEQSKIFKLRIVGHTDDVGNAEANNTLSYERANSVKARLVAMGVEESRILVEGRGEGEPKFGPSGPNGTFTNADRGRNRRIEFIIE